MQLNNVVIQTQKSLPLNVVYRIFPSYLTLKLVNLSKNLRPFALVFHGGTSEKNAIT